MRDEEFLETPVPDTKPIYHDGLVHVVKEKCGTCIFKPGNLMNLASGRVKSMVEGSIEDGASITCHKTLYGGSDQHAVCRGFYDSYKEQVKALWLAEALGRIKEVEASG